MRPATIALYGGAALTAIAVAVLAFTQDTLPGYAAASIATYLYVVYGVGAGLWLWTAWASRRDRPWTRIATTGIFLFGTALLAYNFTQPHPMLITVTGLLPAVCGAVAVALLWRRTHA